MKNKTRFRLWGIVSIILVGAAILWQVMPESSAQRNNKSLVSSNPEPASIPAAAEDLNSVMLNTGKINVKSAEALAERTAVGDFAGKKLHLVRFSGPIQGKWLDMLNEAGLEVVDYIPNYTYLVFGDAPSLQRMQAESRNALSPIEWDGDYKENYKIMPSVYFDPKADQGQNGLRTERFLIQLVADDSMNAETFGLLKGIQTAPIRGEQRILKYVNFSVGLDENGIAELAKRPDVISIYPRVEPQKYDERQDMIFRGNLTGTQPTPGDYLAYLASKGFTQEQFETSNFLVDVTDSGVDTGTPASPNQFLLRRLGDPSAASRFVYSRLEGSPHSGSTLQGCDGHGNLNTTIVAGYVPSGGVFDAAPHRDASNFRYGLGIAPFVKVGSSVIFDPDTFTNPVYADLQSRAYQNGARISTNSWGASVGGAYNSDSQAYDALVRDAAPASSAVPVAGNQEMVIVFSAGNSGSSANTIGSPGTGKNIITVGASENVQAFGGSDGCGLADTGADSAMDIISFSSRGPNDDGRFGPNIVLPGTHVSGGAAQNVQANPVSGTGTKISCFTADGVCGGPSPGFDFFPLGQEWYTASSGTSHSAPAIAGFAALIRQHFINKGFTPPSPAMTKAVMSNTAEYMTGVGANDSLPSNSQGMGLADGDRYFDTVNGSVILRDELAGDVISDTGTTRVLTGTVVDNTKPFRVTLAWTDAPGSTSGNAYVNNLDLEVTVGGNSYKGNVFSGANSATGGSADVRNNVESVFVPAGVSGAFVVKVKGTNIAGDGLPGNADTTDQDYALVVSNSAEAALPVIENTGITITSENGTPANGAPDPGESLAVDFGLRNVGTSDTSNVTVTLLGTGGISNPGPSQNYGVLTAGGAAVTKNFTFSVPAAAACGSDITLTFEIHDGANVSTVTKTYTLGTLQVVAAENFDGVTTPALPAGWTSLQTSGTGITWTTVTAQASSSPNSAFANDPGAINAAALVSPTIAVNSAAARLEFKNFYNTEASTAAGVGYDGAVLEIAIDGGAFQDILAAGGAFVSNGYNRTISTSFSNPLAGRQAWSGNAGGFLDTVVTLPAAANGHNIQLRWVMGSDSSIAATGIWIDNIQIYGGYQCATAGGPSKVRADFDGDGKTDFSIFRPSEGNWYILGSEAGFLSSHWGLSTDNPLAGDFSGDGQTDVIVSRANAGNKEFHVLSTDTFTYEGFTWGYATDKELIGDYDGDGKDECAIFRDGTWYIRDDNSSYRAFTWGGSGDTPLAGDFNGDGKTDLAVYRPSDHSWYVAYTDGNAISGQTSVVWGLETDKLVPADYDGDGKDDFAVYRPSDGHWYIYRSSDSGYDFIYWGASTDVPVPGDYDGDGKYDVAVFRDGAWYVLGSQNGFMSATWGAATDIPIPAKYLP